MFIILFDSLVYPILITLPSTITSLTIPAFSAASSTAFSSLRETFYNFGFGAVVGAFFGAFSTTSSFL